MLLKLLSTPELNFHSTWANGWNKIKNLESFDKWMTVFWFLGPFIYLIERDPADLWLTLIGIVFLIRCFLKKEWSWSSQFWFKCALALWLFGLFSAVTSYDPFFTFQQGFVWIRFPIYAAAAQVWLAKDRDIRSIMLIFMLLGMIIMSLILIAEAIIEPKLRLTWPYGDLVPGGYIAKVSLPVFCVLIALAVSVRGKAGMFSGLLGILSIGVSILTGERTNTLIRMCGGILSSIVWKPKFLMVATLIFFETIAVVIMLYARPDLKSRFSTHFLSQMPLIGTSDVKSEKNSHWGAWRGGIQQGLLTPIKGIGPSGTRNTCGSLNSKFPEWLPGKNYCGNHPHNFYIQLFAEVGLVGLLIGSLMFSSIIITCYKARLENFDCPMAATAFVIPLALFFPIQQFGSFYGQWGNLFIWFAVAFAISQYQEWDNVRSKLKK